MKNLKGRKTLAVLITLTMLITLMIPLKQANAGDNNLHNILNELSNSNTATNTNGTANTANNIIGGTTQPEILYSITSGDATFVGSRKLGDINLDNIVSHRDYDLLRQCLHNNETIEGLRNADINCDGTIDDADVTAMQRYLAEGKGNDFPVGTELKIYAVNEDAGFMDNNEIMQGDLIWTTTPTNSEAIKITYLDHTTVSVKILGEGAAHIVAKDADNSGQTSSFYIRGVADTDSKRFGSVSISKDDFSRKILLTVDNSMEEFPVTGISADVYLNQIFLENPSVKSLSEGWSVTQSNFETGKLSFVAEANDEIINGGEIPEQGLYTYVTFEISVPEVHPQYTWPYNFTDVTVDKSTFRMATTDSTINPFVYYNGDFGLYLKNDVEPYRVYFDSTAFLQTYTDVQGTRVFAKLNPQSSPESQDTESVGFVSGCLEVREGYLVEFLDKDSNFLGDSDKAGEIRKVLVRYNYQGGMIQDQYLTFTELGDICKDESNAIDINDVTYLRKEIVGIYGKTHGRPDNFDYYATDVNNSNISQDGERSVGDIGDVILIRRRIINSVWD